jgi:hypothetical protein
MKSQRLAIGLSLLNAVLLLGLGAGHVRSLSAGQTALPASKMRAFGTLARRCIQPIF